MTSSSGDRASEREGEGGTEAAEWRGRSAARRPVFLGCHLETQVLPTFSHGRGEEEEEEEEKE